MRHERTAETSQVYEHSYHMDFGAKAASYVDTFMDAVRWNNAERIFVHMTSG